MFKTSVLILAFALFAFSAPVSQQEKAQGINDFISGFIETTGFPVTEKLADECVSGFIGLGDHDYLQGKPTDEAAQVELVINALSVFEVCAQAFGETYSVLLREIHMMLHNRDLYFENLFENHEEILKQSSGMMKAIHNRNFFRAGKKFGKLANIIFAKNHEEVKAIRKQTIKQIKVGTLSPNTTGVYALLDNATLFIEGYGNGFNIDNTAANIVDAETGIIQFVNCSSAFFKNATKDPNIQQLLKDLGCAWNGFSNFTEDGTAGADEVYEIYEPAIELAEKNATQVEVDFETNLKSAPLKSGFDLLAFKTDLRAGNYFGAGNAAGELSTIGLKGLVNLTATN